MIPMIHYYAPAQDKVLAHAELAAAFPEVSIPSAMPLDASSMEALGIAQLVNALVPSAEPRCTPVRGAILLQEDGVYRQLWIQRPWDIDQVATSYAVQRAYLLQAVTDMRWQKETGGIELPGGIRVGTTSADQARITAVVANAQLGGIDEVDFKAESGWVTLPLDQVRGIAGAIARHVQACFTAERRHHEAIAAAADVDLPAYDLTTGWPA